MRLPDFLAAGASAAIVVLPAEEFIDAPEFMEPEVPALPVVAAALPAVEPCAAAPAPVPPGVPVVPMGVFCVLRWPAPTAGSEAGRGGVPWAMARLTVAAAATAARILSEDMGVSLVGLFMVTGGIASESKIGERHRCNVSAARTTLSDGS